MTASGGLSDDCKWVVGPMVDGSNGRGSMGQMVNGVVGHFFCYGLWWWVDMADKGDGGGFFFFFFFYCGLWWWVDVVGKGDGGFLLVVAWVVGLWWLWHG